MQVATGTVTVGTGVVTTTYTVSGLPFQPVAVLLCYSGRATAGQGEASHTWGVGVFTSTSLRRVYTCASLHANASGQAQMMWRNDACVATINPDTGAVVALADVDAITPDGFRLIVDDAFPADLLVGYIAIGGPEVKADIVDFVAPAAPGTTDVTTAFSLDTGQDDKLLISLGGVNAAANTGTVWGEFGIGVAAGHSISQAVTYFATQDNVPTTATWGYGRSGQLGVFSTSPDTISNSQFSLLDWLSTGFRLNWTAAGGSSIRYSALVLRGGRYAVRTLTTSTGSNQWTASSPYVPLGILLGSANRVESTLGTTSAQAEMSLGAATRGNNRWCAGVMDKDNSADSDVGIAFNTDALLVNQSTAATIAVEGLLDIQTLLTTIPGFTWMMDDPDPTANFAWYVIFANQPCHKNPWYRRATA